MSVISQLMPYIDADDWYPVPEGAQASVAKLQDQWPHPIPADHLEFLHQCGFYNGGLNLDGESVRGQSRIFDVETVLEEYDFFSGDLEMPHLLPIGGQDSWRECLTEDGRYVTVDQGAGDEVHRWEATTLVGLVAEMAEYGRTE